MAVRPRSRRCEPDPGAPPAPCGRAQGTLRVRLAAEDDEPMRSFGREPMKLRRPPSPPDPVLGRKSPPASRWTDSKATTMSIPSTERSCRRDARKRGPARPMLVRPGAAITSAPGATQPRPAGRPDARAGPALRKDDRRQRPAPPPQEPHPRTAASSPKSAQGWRTPSGPRSCRFPRDGRKGRVWRMSDSARSMPRGTPPPSARPWRT